ncbi:MAG: amidinotransferase [Desulfobacterales bacterium]|nr:amidinotransferase [Desulfobacterales bacterium]
MLNNEGARLTRVVVCTPGDDYFNPDSLAEHNLTQLADRDLTLKQHAALKETLRLSGAEVMDLSGLPGHPNSVFTRDTALVTPKGYIKLRMGLDTRHNEEAWMAAHLDSIGMSFSGEIVSPGTVEGGDVILAGRVAFVGRTMRTNDEGIRQLSVLLEEMDYEIRIIPLPCTILHLDKAMMMTGPDSIIYCRELMAPEFLEGFDRTVLSCYESATANIICLGPAECIVDNANSRVIEKLETNGTTVHALDLSEFAKGTGGPNCLIMPVERTP